MEKEKIIAKFKIKDQNRELENVLQTKNFSKLCNNLLLSMMYKIENSYEDYKKIKVEVPNKTDFIEDIINTIDRDCKNIEIVNPNEEDLNLHYRKNKVLKEEKKIVSLQNELAILDAIYKVNTNSFKLESNNPIRKKAITKMLNIGEQTSKCEILRDFDGWSWNKNLNETVDYTSWLLYEIIIYLLGYNFLNSNKNMNLSFMEQYLKEKYKPTLGEKIFKVINQFAIVKHLLQNKQDIDALKQLEKELQEQLELMSDKKTYIELITKEKKQCIKEIEKIDKYINNDLELKKEYIKQNKELPQEERVFSLSDFSEKVLKQKDDYNLRVKDLTERLKPKNFVTEKNLTEKNYAFINELELDNLDLNKFIQSLIGVFFKAFNEEINNITNKKELKDKIYELRYINLFYIDQENTIGKAYRQIIEKAKKYLITAACNLKLITIFSKNVNENYKIYKNIFETKIIDLDSVYIEITKDNILKLYDENSIEKEENLNLITELIVKRNKKIKMFL